MDLDPIEMVYFFNQILNITYILWRDRTVFDHGLVNYPLLNKSKNMFLPMHCSRNTQ